MRGCIRAVRLFLSATMKPMKILMFALMLTAAAGAAPAQDFPTEPYDFMMAKLAAEEGRYDEALTRIDRVLTRNPDDPVLMYERAMILLDAGRVERAESELRRLVTIQPEFFDAQ